MIISSRGELVHLINNSSVETSPINSEVGTQMFNSIIEKKSKHKREKSRYYRIKWGEVLDDNDVSHLWYDPKGVEVFLNSFEWAPGWKTKREIQEVKLAKEKLESYYQMNDCVVFNVEKNIIGSNPPRERDDESLTTMGKGPGGGKTEHASGRTAQALSNNESVLFFSTESDEEEVRRRILRTMTRHIHDKFEDREVILDRDIDKLKKAKDELNKSRLIVIDNKNIIDENLIRRKMSEVSNSKQGLDLVVIDYLQMVVYDENLNNYEEVSDIHSRLDDLARELDCKVLITTQIQDV